MAFSCRTVRSLIISPRVALFRSKLSDKPTASKPLLTFFTKKNEECSLCDDAKEILKKFSSKFVYEEKYIDDPANELWFSKYKHDIPVIHINGEYLMKHKINERLLTRTLRELTK